MARRVSPDPRRSQPSLCRHTSLMSFTGPETWEHFAHEVTTFGAEMAGKVVMACAKSTEVTGVTRGGLRGPGSEPDGQVGAALRNGPRLRGRTAGSGANQPTGGKRTAARARGAGERGAGALPREEAQAAPDLVLVDDGGGVPVADAMLVSKPVRAFFTAQEGGSGLQVGEPLG
jgi:hypothetical protein